MMSCFHCVPPALYTIVLTYSLLSANVYASKFFLNHKTSLPGHVTVTLQSSVQLGLE